MLPRVNRDGSQLEWKSMDVINIIINSYRKMIQSAPNLRQETHKI